jgi:hypothetical protein
MLPPGMVVPFCNPDWSPLLQVLGTATVQARPMILTKPADETTIAVDQISMDGTTKHVDQSGWMYDRGTNAVTLTSLPPVDSTIEVSYETACP